MKMPIWIPRAMVLTVAVIMVILSFDLFDMEVSPWQFAQALVIHNIPTFALLAVLIATWRRPRIAAVTFFILGGTIMVIFNTWRDYRTWAVLSLPFLIITLQFLLADYDGK